MIDDVAYADRVAGMMMGAAIGDALGSAFEFVSSENIEKACGEPFVRDYRPAHDGSRLYPRAPGQPTDDTAMALSVAKTLYFHAFPTAKEFAHGFLTDLDEHHGPYGDMFWKGGPGGATTKALGRLRHGADAATCGAPEDGGNGAAMRAHPIAILEHRSDVLRIAAVQARITHGHPAAVAAAQAVAVLVFDGIHGEPLSIDVPSGVEEPTFLATWNAFHADLTIVDGRLPKHLRDVGMSGWETVAAAHAIVCCYATDLSTSIAAAAASGGDTDTIASIAGAIAGSQFVAGALPERLISGLSASDLVSGAIQGLLGGIERE